VDKDAVNQAVGPPAGLATQTFGGGKEQFF